MSLFDSPIIWSCIVVGLIAATIYWLRRFSISQSKRIATIESFTLPKDCMDQFKQKHPHLSQQECVLVEQGLRQFFLVARAANQHYVVMPSQAVDDLWQAFILCTHEYVSFCQQAFGRYLQRNPADMAQAASKQITSMRACWREACQLEEIIPTKPVRLPLLFALDERLQIKAGFHYRFESDRPARGQLQAKGDHANALPGGTLLSFSVMADNQAGVRGGNRYSDQDWFVIQTCMSVARNFDSGGGGCSTDSGAACSDGQ